MTPPIKNNKPIEYTTHLACVLTSNRATKQPLKVPIAWAKKEGHIKATSKPLADSVAAVSVGIIDGVPILDLCYEEEVRADTDMNVVCSGDGRFIEVQGTAEGVPFDRTLLNQLLDLAVNGCKDLAGMQSSALSK